jgi:anti-sigma B factor antagonist
MADMRRKGIDMTISKKQDEKELVIFIEGRLDSTTAPALDMEVKALNGVESLVFDLEKLEYISSAGFRILLSAQKKMSKQGDMVVKNVRKDIYELFEVSGFNEILTIK